MAQIPDQTKQRHADRVQTVVQSGVAAATSMVAASWARSVRLHGLNPEGQRESQLYSAPELSVRREQMERLLHVSSPTLERLFSMISLAGCGVFLSDADGVVLEHRTNSGDEAGFSRSGLTSGADWSERYQGTNGIGTCIAEGRAVSIHRDQHFISSNIAMTCIGAPIFDSTGDLSAVLDVSSCREDLDGPLATLIAQAVNDAAGQIEADHFCDVYSGLRILRGEGDRKRSPVLLAVNGDDLVVGATRAARRQYGLPNRDSFTPKPTSDLLGDASARGEGLDGAERRELARAIARADGNMTEAAKSLGVSRATLYRRANKLGLLTQ